MNKSIEVPEAKTQVKNQTTAYPREWLDKQVDILLGLIVTKLPIIGLTICQNHLDTPRYKALLRDKLSDYYLAAHQYAFTQLKNVIKTKMSPEDHDFSFETIRALIVSLEEEYCAALPELGIESDNVIDSFTKNQVAWLKKSFSWKVA